MAKLWIIFVIPERPYIVQQDCTNPYNITMDGQKLSGPCHPQSIASQVIMYMAWIRVTPINIYTNNIVAFSAALANSSNGNMVNFPK